MSQTKFARQNRARQNVRIESTFPGGGKDRARAPESINHRCGGHNHTDRRFQQQHRIQKLSIRDARGNGFCVLSQHGLSFTEQLSNSLGNFAAHTRKAASTCSFTQSTKSMYSFPNLHSLLSSGCGDDCILFHRSCLKSIPKGCIPSNDRPLNRISGRSSNPWVTTPTNFGSSYLYALVLVALATHSHGQGALCDTSEKMFWQSVT